MSPSPPTE
ncbi:hypothetical protein ECPA49_1354, partial [Escherichia coli PA49]